MNEKDSCIHIWNLSVMKEANRQYGIMVNGELFEGHALEDFGVASLIVWL